MTTETSFLSNMYRQLLPTLLQQKIDVLRGQSQVFWAHFMDTNSLFIHVPKAAGTSIARSIYGRNVGHRKAIDYQKVSQKHFNELFKFSFVRNPWDRAVSAYQFVIQGGTEYVQPDENSIYGAEKFTDFETFATQWLPYADLSKEDVVFEPQYKYVCNEQYEIIVDYLGKLENLDEDIAYIAKKLVIDIEVQKLNQSTKIKKSYRDYYTEASKEAVRKVYQKDIGLFGYEF